VFQTILASWVNAGRQRVAAWGPHFDADQLWPCDWCGRATDVVPPSGKFCSETCQALAERRADLPVRSPVQSLLARAGAAGLRPAAASQLVRLAGAVAAEHHLAE
jgi:hypothetical protein